MTIMFGVILCLRKAMQMLIKWKLNSHFPYIGMHNGTDIFRKYCNNYFYKLKDIKVLLFHIVCIPVLLVYCSMYTSTVGLL